MCVLAFQRAIFYVNRCSGSVFDWVRWQENDHDCSRKYWFEASRLWDPKIDSSPFPNTDQRDRFELLYPCSRHQHSPRSFHTCTTTVETHREISWSLNSHYTTTWTRHPNWHPTTRWHLNSRHVDWRPTFYDGVTVDIFLEQCHMAMALQIFRF